VTGEAAAAGTPPELLRIADVTVRRLRPDDLDDYLGSLERSREHLAVWEPWAAAPFRRNLVERSLVDVDDAWRSGRAYVFGVWRDGRFAGSCGLWPTDSPSVRTIGYWTDVDHVERGVAGAAATAATFAGFQLAGVETLEIHCDVAHQVSARIPTRLGYRVADTRVRVLGVPAEAGRVLVFRLAREHYRMTWAWRRWQEERVG
jgi:RimJ/RimL family protein N-acetyltransferase